ncbi:MAG: hypothetical protein ACU0BO_07605 [Limimaricola soesokkakensis]
MNHVLETASSPAFFSSLLMLIGATLILGGNYLNIRAEARRPEAA